MPWTDASYLSAPVLGFPAGPALATVIVNGIPSASAILGVEPFAASSLASVAREKGGTRVRWRAIFAGASYRVQFSDALPGPWQPAAGGTLMADANGIIEYLDATSPAPTNRFYRLVSPP